MAQRPRAGGRAGGGHDRPRHPHPQEWGDQGWRLVIDPFTGQVTALDAVRRAYAVLAGAAPGDLDELMGVYRDLPVIAGLEELYDIERATTEPGT